MLNHRLHVAHIPHRWYALEEKEHGVNQLRVVGGVCDCCLKAAVQFYGQINVNNNNNNSIMAITIKSVLVMVMVMVTVMLLVLVMVMVMVITAPL